MEHQLDQIVDLSVLAPEMSASEAFDVIRMCVDPPLNLVVLWKDTLDQAEVEPSTPIDLDPLPEVRVGTGLEMICKSLGGAYYHLGYQIRDDVIVVASRETLDGMISSERRDSHARWNYFQEHEMIQRCKRLVETKDDIALEVSELGASHKAISDEIRRLHQDIETQVRMSEEALELEPLLQALEAQKENDKRMMDVGRLTSREATTTLQKLAETKIRLAEYRLEISKRYGGAVLQELNSQLAKTTIQLAEQQARLTTVFDQLRTLETQLRRADQMEIQHMKHQLKSKALERCLTRILELEEQLDPRARPTVILMEAGQ